jgi:hypothetical protein
MEINENGTLPLSDEEAESVTGGESNRVQIWRRIAEGEGRGIQIGYAGLKTTFIVGYEGWIPAKCPSCGAGEALFASDRIVPGLYRQGENTKTITFKNCKCYICNSAWGELYLNDTHFNGTMSTGR